MRVGYARASSKDQKLEVQLAKLAGCDRVFAEKKSGTLRARPELDAALAFCREGDTLVCTRLDRLARSTSHLIAIVEELGRKRVDLVVTEQAIDTTTAVGKLLFHVLAAIAEFEHTIRAERVQEGLAHAIARGVQLGPLPKLTEAQAAELRARRAAGERIARLARDYHLHQSTVYRYLQPAEAVPA